jgi:tetratricopeptide (TPR) repeat protein
MHFPTLAIGAFLILAHLELPAQRKINFSRYYNENVLPTLQKEEFVPLDVEWTMGGNAQTFLNSGLTDLDKQNFVAASENFLQFTKLLPSSYVGHYYLGVSLKAEGRHDGAQSSLAEAIRLSPGCWQCEHELGNALLLNQKLKFAAKHFERAIQLNPKAADSYFSLAQLELIAEGLEAQSQRLNPSYAGPNYGKAFRYFEKATAVNPTFAKAYVMQGLIKMPNMVKNQDALVYFNKAISVDSTSKEALFWRGLFFIYQNQPANALKDWDRLVQYNPSIPQFVLMRGYLNVELERFDQAFADLRKAALSKEVNDEKFRGQHTTFDKLVDIQFATRYVARSSYGLTALALQHFKKGFCFLVAGRHEESLEELGKAEAQETAAVIYFTKAIVHEHSGQHPDAFKYYNMAIEADADIFDAYKKRSIYRTELKDWAGAMADYREMIRLQPESKITEKLRGYTKSSYGDFNGAILDFTSFLQSDSTDSDAYLNRGFCNDQLKNCENATRDFVKALAYDSLNEKLYEFVADQALKCSDSIECMRIRRWHVRSFRPDYAKPWLNLAELEIYLKEFDQAHQHVDEALRLIGQWTAGPLYARAIRLKGLIHYNNKAFKEALEVFSRGHKEQPTELEIWYLKAMCHMLLGDRKMAVREFNELRKRPYKDSAKIYASLLQNEQKESMK